MKKRKTKPSCGYCGIRPQQSRDHVVPKALFGKPTPQNVITVGACVPCNQAKSPSDDYLRDCLACDIRVRANPAVKVLRAGPIARSVETNRSVLSRQAIQYGRFSPMFTPQGLYAGQCVSVPVSADRLAGALWFIVRGLYYHETRNTLPTNYVYAFAPVRPEYCNSYFDDFCKSRAAGLISIGEAVFDAKYTVWSEDPFTTNWCLRFYQRIVYCVFVTSRANAQRHLIPMLGATNSPIQPDDMPIVLIPE